MRLSVIAPFCCLGIWVVLGAATGFGQPQNSATVKGKVIDYQSGQPIQDANVFLANTMMGDASDAEGRFEIRNIPLGSHELVVSFIGYEVRKIPLRFTRPATREFTIRLEQKPIEAPEIAVSAEEMKDWQKSLDRFKELFLGTSENARACTIVNETALDFVPQKGSKPFRAYAAEPLIIENRALGYRLTFHLESFEARNTEVKYLGRARFEELTGASREEKARWEQNRIATYRGSLRHFLSALYNNRHKQEGFLAYQLPVFPQGNERVDRIEIHARDLFQSGELPFEKTFRFENFLEVIYTKEMEEDGYIAYRMSLDPSLMHLDPESYRKEAEPRNQTSLLAMNTYSLTVDSTGLIDNPFGLTLWGYWSWERVADLLPSDYEAPFYTQEALLVQANRDFYGEGLEHRKSGDWQAALATWEQGRTILDLLGRVDPRIGLAFIETVAENDAADKFELATDMYYWAFSGEIIAPFKEELEKEIAMLEPLLEPDQSKQWKNLLKKNDAALYRNIKEFWITRDPTPSSLLNERSIEHWQRIAYAREHFKKSISTVYGTDDRGLIYVRYGQPDRRLQLTLGINMAELHRWARPDFSEAQRVDVTSEQETNQERDMLGEGEEPARPRVISISGIDSQELESRLRNEIAKYNYAPECELWAYQGIDETRDIVFIFGPENGHGAYGLRDGIEEFIPGHAFNTSNIDFFGGILPGGVLQMMFYRDVAAFDVNFARRYALMEEEWLRAYQEGKLAPPPTAIKLFRSSFLSEDRFNAPSRYVARDRSGYRKFYRPIRLIASRARFLDEQDRPYITFVTFAFPQGLSRFRTDEMLNINVHFDYALRFTVIVRDENFDELQRVFAEPVQQLDHFGLLRLPHKSQQAFYTLAAEAFPRDAAEADAGPDRLPGIGQTHFEGLEPLNTDANQLEISDLVIGVAPPPDFDATLLPFPVVPSTTIWKADALKVYFEAYHLRLHENGKAQYSLDIRVFELNRNGGRYKRQEMISSIFDYQANGRTAKDTFGVSIANLDKGEYEIEIEVTDKLSGKKGRRSARFTVMD